MTRSRVSPFGPTVPPLPSRLCIMDGSRFERAAKETTVLSTERSVKSLSTAGGELVLFPMLDIQADLEFSHRSGASLGLFCVCC